jgi:hypothetical protein
MDFQRACQLYLWGLPIVGVARWRQAYQEAFGMGFRAANLCLIHRDNVSGRLDDDRGYISRNYHLYHLLGKQ